MLAGLLLAAATLHAAPAAGPPRPPDAIYGYTIMIGGATVGNSSVTIDGSGGSHDILIVERNLGLEHREFVVLEYGPPRTATHGIRRFAGLPVGGLLVARRGLEGRTMIVGSHGAGAEQRECPGLE